MYYLEYSHKIQVLTCHTSQQLISNPMRFNLTILVMLSNEQPTKYLKEKLQIQKIYLYFSRDETQISKFT